MSSTLPAELRRTVLAPARVEVPGAGGGSTVMYKCAHCRLPFPLEDVQIDHITPEADGGSHDPINLQVLCAPKAGAGCHRIKSREEAKARAKRAAEKVDVLGALIKAVFSGTAALVIIYAAWLSYQGKPLMPFVHSVHHWVGVFLLACLAALGAAVLVHLPGVTQKMVRVEDERREVPLATKFHEALAERMGADIKTKQVEKGVEVRYGAKVKDEEPNERLKILERVNMKMGGRWEPRWDGEHNRVIFMPRPDFPKMVRHPGLDADRPWYLLPIADGITIDLRTTSHALIIGATNAGKTAVIRSIIIAAIDSAKRGEVESVLIDPKRVELIGFRGWPGVREVVTGDEAMWQIPITLVAEMERRYRAYEEDKIPLKSHKPWIVVLDEYEDYVKGMIAHWLEIDPATKKPRKKPGESEPPPVAAMAKLLRKARKCGIHIIIGTQRPDAKWFGGAARDNLQCRIGVGPLSRSAAEMAFDRTDVGRDLPVEAKGRMTVQILNGGFEEAQSWWVPDPGDADNENTDADWAHLARLGRPAA